MLNRILIVLAVFLAVALGVAAPLFLGPATADKTFSEYFGTPEYQSVDPGKDISVQTSTFEIAGRTFEMPKVYIQTNLGGKRILPDGVNLLYVLPDFTSRADFKTREEYKQAKREARFGHMLVEPEAPRPSFDVMIENLRRDLIKEEYIGVHDGLEYYRWYRGKPEAPIHWYDVYIEKDTSGRVSSLIDCATSERGPHIRFPGCSHKFRDKSLLYNIYYNKENYLSTWNEQRRRAIEFIDSFERTADSQPTKEN